MRGRTDATARGTALTATFVAALVMAQPLSAEPAPAGLRSKLPADAEAYLARRRGCNHWTGEEAYDAARGRDIAAAVKALRCESIDADEARLRRRHGKDPAVLKGLNEADGDGG